MPTSQATEHFGRRYDRMRLATKASGTDHSILFLFERNIDCTGAKLTSCKGMRASNLGDTTQLV